MEDRSEGMRNDIPADIPDGMRCCGRIVAERRPEMLEAFVSLARKMDRFKLEGDGEPIDSEGEFSDLSPYLDQEEIEVLVLLMSGYNGELSPEERAVLRDLVDHFQPAIIKFAEIVLTSTYTILVVYVIDKLIKLYASDCIFN